MNNSRLTVEERKGTPLTVEERKKLLRLYLKDQYIKVLPQLPIEVERNSRKFRLALAFRIFASYHFDEGTSGHITVRDPEYLDCLWVNSFGVYWGHITVDDLILVNKEGKIIAGNGVLNPSAYSIHAAIHEARPEAVASCHTHSEYGRAWSSLGGKLLDPINQDACSFYEDHSIYSTYGGVASETDEGKLIVKALGKHKACILQNHGLLTVGETVDEAVWWFISMERCCKIQILAESVQKPVLIPHDVAQLTAVQMGSPFIGWYQFQPLYQMAVRKYPDVVGLSTHNTALGITSPSLVELQQFRSKL